MRLTPGLGNPAVIYCYVVVFTFGRTLFLGETLRHLILGESSYVRVKIGRRCSTRDKHRHTDKEMGMMIRLEFSKALQDIIMLDF